MSELIIKIDAALKEKPQRKQKKVMIEVIESAK